MTEEDRGSPETGAGEPADLHDGLPFRPEEETRRRRRNILILGVVLLIAYLTPVYSIQDTGERYLGFSGSEFLFHRGYQPALVTIMEWYATLVGPAVILLALLARASRRGSGLLILGTIAASILALNLHSYSRTAILMTAPPDWLGVAGIAFTCFAFLSWLAMLAGARSRWYRPYSGLSARIGKLGGIAFFASLGLMGLFWVVRPSESSSDFPPLSPPWPHTVAFILQLFLLAGSALLCIANTPARTPSTARRLARVAFLLLIASIALGPVARLVHDLMQAPEWNSILFRLLWLAKMTASYLAFALLAPVGLTDLLVGLHPQEAGRMKTQMSPAPVEPDTGPSAEARPAQPLPHHAAVPFSPEEEGEYRRGHIRILGYVLLVAFLLPVIPLGGGLQAGPLSFPNLMVLVDGDFTLGRRVMNLYPALVGIAVFLLARLAPATVRGPVMMLLGIIPTAMLLAGAEAARPVSDLFNMMGTGVRVCVAVFLLAWVGLFAAARSRWYSPDLRASARVGQAAGVLCLAAFAFSFVCAGPAGGNLLSTIRYLLNDHAWLAGVGLLVQSVAILATALICIVNFSGTYAATARRAAKPAYRLACLSAVLFISLPMLTGFSDSHDFWGRLPAHASNLLKMVAWDGGLLLLIPVGLTDLLVGYAPGEE